MESDRRAADEAVLDKNLKSKEYMRSSRVVRASESHCRSRKCPGFDPSILRHRAADETVLNIVSKKENIKNSTFNSKERPVLT